MLLKNEFIYGMKNIVLLHGAIGAKDQLQPLADLLKNDFIVHVFNFSGHGGKPFAEEHFSIEAIKVITSPPALQPKQ